jgi:phosphoglycerate kinase
VIFRPIVSFAKRIVGGGDSATSFTRYIDMSKLNYVSTAGGALLRYLSGVQLPLIEAMSRQKPV